MIILNTNKYEIRLKGRKILPGCTLSVNPHNISIREVTNSVGVLLFVETPSDESYLSYYYPHKKIMRYEDYLKDTKSEIKVEKPVENKVEVEEPTKIEEVKEVPEVKETPQPNKRGRGRKSKNTPVIDELEKAKLEAKQLEEEFKLQEMEFNDL